MLASKAHKRNNKKEEGTVSVVGGGLGERLLTKCYLYVNN